MTLQDEIRRRRELGLPAMTPEDQRAFQQNLTDTAAGDARLAQIGSTKTTMKGAKIVDGPYKGMTPAAARQAAITGAMPPGKHQPGRMGTVRGSLTGDSLYSPTPPRIAAPAPSAAPAPVNAAPRAPSVAGTAKEGQSAAQNLLTIPALGGAKPPLQSAAKPPAVASAAPRPQGMINGQPSGQFFQEAANKQGIPNNYGTVKPQSVSPPSPAPRPVDPALIEPRGFGPPPPQTPPVQDKLTPLIQGTQQMLDKARSPAAPSSSVPAPVTAAAPSGPPLSLSAPKWQPQTPTNGSPVADTMKNNQMIRPGFDAIIAAQRPPVPTAAMPKPPGGTARPGTSLKPPQLAMVR